MSRSSVYAQLFLKSRASMWRLAWLMAVAAAAVLGSVAGDEDGADEQRGPELVRMDVFVLTIVDALCAYGASNPVSLCVRERKHIGLAFEYGATLANVFNATLDAAIDPKSLDDVDGIVRHSLVDARSAAEVGSRAANLTAAFAALQSKTSTTVFDVIMPGAIKNASTASGSMPLWDVIDDVVARLMAIPRVRIALFLRPAAPAQWQDQVFSARWLVAAWDSRAPTCALKQVYSLAQARIAVLMDNVCAVRVPDVARFVRGPSWALVVANAGAREDATVGVTCHAGDNGLKLFAFAGQEWAGAHVSQAMVAEWWRRAPPALAPWPECRLPAADASASPAARASTTTSRPAVPPTQPPARPKDDDDDDDAYTTLSGNAPSAGAAGGPPSDNGTLSWVPDEAFWAGAGAGVVLACLCCACALHRCCCSSRAKGFRPIDERDVEMRTLGIEQTPPAPPVAFQQRASAASPRLPHPSSGPTLDAMIASTATYFETNPAIGAQGFEELWNKSQVVDVWGHTVAQVPVGVRIAPLMARLRCVVVASGKVNGVEKMYFFARGRATAQPMMALLEVSVNLSSRRLRYASPVGRGTGTDAACVRAYAQLRGQVHGARRRRGDGAALSGV